MAELLAYGILGGVIVATALLLWGFVQLVTWSAREP
jgi:hypothetical protein